MNSSQCDVVGMPERIAPGLRGLKHDLAVGLQTVISMLECITVLPHGLEHDFAVGLQTVISMKYRNRFFIQRR